MAGSDSPALRVAIVGKTISHYRILEKLGEGGMGVVYKALDLRLDRFVALKVLPPDLVAEAGRRKRFVREAKSASGLNHPHIVTIHDIEESDGVDFIAMEWLEGKTLDECIPPGGLPLGPAVKYAADLASAMAAAHAAGIVHRDLKPANVMIGPRGDVKVLDFGLAKLTERQGEDAAPAQSSETAAGLILGTPAYMSPEQAAGQPVDVRTDVFSFGILLYEMLTDISVFRRDTGASTLAAVLLCAPPPLASKRKDLPAALLRIVDRCLQKDREARYASAVSVHRELQRLQESLAPRAISWRTLARNPRWLAAGVLLLALAAAASVWLGVRTQRTRWARNTALPEAARLIEGGKTVEAFRLVRQVGRILPGDAELLRLRGECTSPASVVTDPPGAQVSWKSYATPGEPWEPLGQSPVKGPLVPNRYLRWRIVKEGFEPAEVARVGGAALVVPLTPRGESAEMVRIPSGVFQFLPTVPIRLDEYRLDKVEVTNREFRAFVDAGGYQRRDFWKQPFVDGSRTLTWDEAMARFRDATGRPGPSTWQVGSYPEGQEEYPVGGVSWYEAAAYAEFVHKSLPTIYHWRRAAVIANFEIMEFSNFSRRGPVRAGSYQGLSPFGNYDMAGNLKEWCWNGSSGRRFLLGASWDEPSYVFPELDARSPFDRSSAFGFRCAKYTGVPGLPLLADSNSSSRDYSLERPVSDEIYRAYRSLFAYDRTPLNPSVEARDDKVEYWRREKVTLDAAYGTDRLPVHLFLPRNAKPPYQAVVYVPGSHAWLENGPSDSVSPREVREGTAYLVQSGRGLVCPVYFGAYERKKVGPVERPSSTSVAMRDMLVNTYKDLARTMDYLETRPDFDKNRLAYYGVSLGAEEGSVFLSQEPRFRTAVFYSGGLWFQPFAPEVDPLNFASRSRTPVLMLNGRYDPWFTLQSNQLPLFRLLGVPEKDKRHVLFDAAHALPQAATIKEVLAWLDRYLGPVASQSR